MNESQFREWLAERGIDEETIKSLVGQANSIEKLYAELVGVGAALDHETWLEDLTSSARGSYLDQVIDVLIGMTGALIAFIEEGD